MLGTCAGMIFLASATTGPDSPNSACSTSWSSGTRSAGRSIRSRPISTSTGLVEPMRAVFIRAPWIDKVGADVEILATVEDPGGGGAHPVVVRQDRILATSFHPELTDDDRLHTMLIELVEER